MSEAVVSRLKAQLGDKVLRDSSFRGGFEISVAPGEWVAAATLLRDDAELSMDHFIDLTAVDHPERGDKARFDVVLIVRSNEHAHRVRVRTQLADGAKLATLENIWAGANWAEREVYDMFGIVFEGHSDMRRILMYEEFEGYPLRKDYPIDKVQPLVPYRQVEGTHKLPPFGIEEGQPFARVDWEARLAGRDNQVSPSIALQQGQRHSLSDSEAAAAIREKLAANKNNTPEQP